MSGGLTIRREGSVTRLILDRTDVGNAINIQLAQALLRAAITASEDENVRCVVLTGAGRMFCAGGDVRLFAAEGDRIDAVLAKLAETLHHAVLCLAKMPKPLLVLVNGPAAGAGLSLALLGDMVLAAPTASFSVAYGAIGLTPDGGCSWLLPRLIGLRRAQEMILTNRRVLADEAAAIGLITRVVDDLAAEGEQAAASLGNAATSAVGATRALLLGSFASDLESQLGREAAAISAAGAAYNGREGVAAFLERRSPLFIGNEDR